MIKSKIYLSLSALLWATIAFGQSPIHTDTICLSRSQFVKVLTKAEQAKVYEQEIIQYKTDTALLSYRIAELKAIIENLKDKDSTNKKIVANYESQIQVMQDQRKLLESQIDNLTKLVKKFHRRMLFRTVEGVALSVVTFILGLKL